MDLSRSIFHFFLGEYCHKGDRIQYHLNFSFPYSFAQGNEAGSYQGYPRALYETDSEIKKMFFQSKALCPLENLSEDIARKLRSQELQWPERT